MDAAKSSLDSEIRNQSQRFLFSSRWKANGPVYDWFRHRGLCRRVYLIIRQLLIGAKAVQATLRHSLLCFVEPPCLTAN